MCTKNRADFGIWTFFLLKRGQCVGVSMRFISPPLFFFSFLLLLLLCSEVFFVSFFDRSPSSCVTSRSQQELYSDAAAPFSLPLLGAFFLLFFPFVFFFLFPFFSIVDRCYASCSSVPASLLHCAKLFGSKSQIKFVSNFAVVRRWRTMSRPHWGVQTLSLQEGSFSFCFVLLSRGLSNFLRNQTIALRFHSRTFLSIFSSPQALLSSSSGGPMFSSILTKQTASQHEMRAFTVSKCTVAATTNTTTTAERSTNRKLPASNCATSNTTFGFSELRFQHEQARLSFYSVSTARGRSRQRVSRVVSDAQSTARKRTGQQRMIKHCGTTLIIIIFGFLVLCLLIAFSETEKGLWVCSSSDLTKCRGSSFRASFRFMGVFPAHAAPFYIMPTVTSQTQWPRACPYNKVFDYGGHITECQNAGLRPATPGEGDLNAIRAAVSTVDEYLRVSCFAGQVPLLAGRRVSRFFRWFDDTPVPSTSNTYWATGEPSNMPGEDCIEFSSSNLLNDCNCGGTRMGPICQGETPCDAATDCNAVGTTKVHGVAPNHCLCFCNSQYMGNKCQQVRCTVDDCGGTTRAFGVSGPRPNCQCSCRTTLFTGDRCELEVCQLSDCGGPSRTAGVSGIRPHCSCTCKRPWVGARECHTRTLSATISLMTSHSASPSGPSTSWSPSANTTQTTSSSVSVTQSENGTESLSLVPTPTVTHSTSHTISLSLSPSPSTSPTVSLTVTHSLSRNSPSTTPTQTSSHSLTPTLSRVTPSHSASFSGVPTASQSLTRGSPSWSRSMSGTLTISTSRSVSMSLTGYSPSMTLTCRDLDDLDVNDTCSIFRPLREPFWNTSSTNATAGRPPIPPQVEWMVDYSAPSKQGPDNKTNGNAITFGSYDRATCTQIKVPFSVWGGRRGSLHSYGIVAVDRRVPLKGSLPAPALAKSGAAVTFTDLSLAAGGPIVVMTVQYDGADTLNEIKYRFGGGEWARCPIAMPAVFEVVLQESERLFPPSVAEALGVTSQVTFLSSMTMMLPSTIAQLGTVGSIKSMSRCKAAALDSPDEEDDPYYGGLSNPLHIHIGVNLRKAALGSDIVSMVDGRSSPVSGLPANSTASGTNGEGHKQAGANWNSTLIEDATPSGAGTPHLGYTRGALVTAYCYVLLFAVLMSLYCVATGYLALWVAEATVKSGRHVTRAAGSQQQLKTAKEPIHPSTSSLSSSSSNPFAVLCRRVASFSAFASYPSILLPGVAFALDGAVGASTVLAVHGSDWGDVLAGCVTLVLCGLFLAHLVYSTAPRYMPVVAVALPDSPKRTSSASAVSVGMSSPSSSSREKEVVALTASAHSFESPTHGQNRACSVQRRAEERAVDAEEEEDDFSLLRDGDDGEHNKMNQVFGNVDVTRRTNANSSANNNNSNNRIYSDLDVDLDPALQLRPDVDRRGAAIRAERGTTEEVEMRGLGATSAVSPQLHGQPNGNDGDLPPDPDVQKRARVHKSRNGRESSPSSSFAHALWGRVRGVLEWLTSPTHEWRSHRYAPQAEAMAPNGETTLPPNTDTTDMRNTISNNNGWTNPVVPIDTYPNSFGASVGGGVSVDDDQAFEAWAQRYGSYVSGLRLGLYTPAEQSVALIVCLLSNLEYAHEPYCIARGALCALLLIAQTVFVVIKRPFVHRWRWLLFSVVLTAQAIAAMLAAMNASLQSQFVELGMDVLVAIVALLLFCSSAAEVSLVVREHYAMWIRTLRRMQQYVATLRAKRKRMRNSKKGGGGNNGEEELTASFVEPFMVQDEHDEEEEMAQQSNVQFNLFANADVRDNATDVEDEDAMSVAFIKADILKRLREYEDRLEAEASVGNYAGNPSRLLE